MERLVVYVNITEHFFPIVRQLLKGFHFLLGFYKSQLSSYH